MRKIARITTQKKNSNRYNIFLLEGEKESYGFSVDESILVEFRLLKGLELSDDDIKKITQKDELYKFYTQSINYLSYRMRTKKEIADYLRKKEVEPVYIEEIIERLEKEKLVDDREFAFSFVRSRINTSTKGPKVIERELMEKGVHFSHIDEALELYSRETQFEKAYKWMEKKLRQSTKHAFRKRLEQIQQSLLQKGFERDVVKEVASEFKDEKNTSEEWDALVYQGERLLRRHSKKFSGFELRNRIKAGLYQRGFSFDLIDRFINERNEQEEFKENRQDDSIF